MENKENKSTNTNEYYTIDLLHIAKTLWRKAWLIVLCGLLCGAIAFSYAFFGIAPKYSSSIMLYVNNSSISLGNTSFSITSSEQTDAQNLVRTYGVILDSRTTLQRVIKAAEVDYTWQELRDMIEYETANDTEIMKMTVTCEDKQDSCIIANTIAEVLPDRISEIIDGATMEVVDNAILGAKVGPSITRYTAIGFVLGVLLSVAVLTVSAVMDDTIHDEEYILNTYDYPILGKVPNLLNTGSKSYSYYSQKTPPRAGS
jgi:capsular polysaccharide biosynthesis protein